MTLDRTVPQREEGKPCSEFMCLVHGNSAAINTVTISRVKVNEDPSEILAVSASDPEININDEDIRGKGTLQGNSAAIYIELSDPSSCVSDSLLVRLPSQTGPVTVKNPSRLLDREICRNSKQCQ